MVLGQLDTAVLNVKKSGFDLAVAVIQRYGLYRGTGRPQQRAEKLHRLDYIFSVKTNVAKPTQGIHLILRSQFKFGVLEASFLHL